MKILHIHDQAGISCILSKYLTKRSIDSKVIAMSGKDKFEIKKFYNNFVVFANKQTFEEICLEESRNADIIHVHSLENIIIRLRKRYGKSKKIILHYHGTDIRGTKNRQYKTIKNRFLFNIMQVRNRLKTKIFLTANRYFNSLHVTAQKLSDVVIVSTPDLLPIVNNSVYLPNPIDSDHFSKSGDIANNKKEALIINNEATNIQNSLKYCKQNNINLKIEIYDRINKPLMYAEMPNFLKKYKIYVDIKFNGDQLISAMSKTGLESLACGLTVLDYNLKYRTEFPVIHEPNYVVDNLLQIYSRDKFH